MSTNYSAKPINAPNITRPGESLEHVGSRSVTTLLPTIFQTTVNKQFLDSTLELIFWKIDKTLSFTSGSYYR